MPSMCVRIRHLTTLLLMSPVVIKYFPQRNIDGGDIVGE